MDKEYEQTMHVRLDNKSLVKWSTSLKSNNRIKLQIHILPSYQFNKDMY